MGLGELGLGEMGQNPHNYPAGRRHAVQDILLL